MKNIITPIYELLVNEFGSAEQAFKALEKNTIYNVNDLNEFFKNKFNLEEYNEFGPLDQGTSSLYADYDYNIETGEYSIKEFENLIVMKNLDFSNKDQISHLIHELCHATKGWNINIDGNIVTFKNGFLETKEELRYEDGKVKSETISEKGRGLEEALNTVLQEKLTKELYDDSEYKVGAYGFLKSMGDHFYSILGDNTSLLLEAQTTNDTTKLAEAIGQENLNRIISITDEAHDLLNSLFSLKQDEIDATKKDIFNRFYSICNDVIINNNTNLINKYINNFNETKDLEYVFKIISKYAALDGTDINRENIDSSINSIMNELDSESLEKLNNSISKASEANPNNTTLKNVLDMIVKSSNSTVNENADKSVANFNIENIDMPAQKSSIMDDPQVNNVQTLDSEYDKTEQLPVVDEVKELIKPSEENLEFFKENLEQSDYSAMKRVYDVITKMLNSKDGVVKNIAEHIQNLTKSRYSNKMSFFEHNILAGTKFANYYRIALELGGGLLNTTNFQTELNASNQVVAHEFGHMLFNLLDYTKPDNYAAVKQSTIESLKEHSAQLDEFFRDADQISKNFDDQAKLRVQKYIETHQEEFNEKVETAIASEKGIKDLASRAYLINEKRDHMLELFRAGNIDELRTLVNDYVNREYGLNEIYHTIEYDPEMMQVSMIAGVIDSIFEGDNPFYEEHYKPYNLRMHGQDYFKKEDMRGFDEQLADYTAMRIYNDDYAVAWSFLKSVLGDEWFNMMDAKFNSLSENIDTLGTTVEEEIPSVDLGIDIEKDDEGYITGINIDIDTLKTLQTLVGRDSYSYKVIGEYINENATEMTHRDFDSILDTLCYSADNSLCFAKEANQDGYFNSNYEKYQNALNYYAKLRGSNVEDVGTKNIEGTLSRNRTQFVINMQEDTESVKKFINACLELQNARTDYYRSNDLILAKNEISDSFKYFKSDEEIASFNSKYEELLKNGTVEDVRNYLNAAQQEILDHWANTVTPIDEYKEGDPFKFICHSVFDSNFKGDFYTRFVSTSLLTDNLTDTYKSGFGFIFNPENIVGAASQDMYIDNAAESTDDLQISSSLPQIDSPEQMISECMELKNKLANEGKEGKVYNEVVIDGFNPAAIFCIIDGTERGYSNYENALKLQEQFPELRVIRLPKNDTIDVTADYRQVATQNAMDEYYEPTAPIEVLTEEDLEDTMPIEVPVAPVYDYSGVESANQSIYPSLGDNQSVEPIKVGDLDLNLADRGQVFNMDCRYKGADYVYKTDAGSITSVINSIKTNGIEGNVIIEIDNTIGLTNDIINQLPDNAKVMVVGSYTRDFLSNFKSGVSAQNSAINTIYSKEELLAINNKIAEIEAGIDSDWSDARKVRYLYNYLRDNIEYDANPKDRSAHYESLTGLTEGLSTCQGFAHIFNELCTRNGIRCREIVGSFGNHGGHAYNIISVSGQYFIVDTVREHLDGNSGFLLTGNALRNYDARGIYEKKALNDIRDNDNVPLNIQAEYRNNEVDYNKIRNSSEYNDFYRVYGSRLDQYGRLKIHSSFNNEIDSVNMAMADAILTNEATFKRFMHYNNNTKYFYSLNPLMYIDAMSLILDSTNTPFSQEVYARYNTIIESFSPMRTIRSLPIVNGDFFTVNRIQNYGEIAREFMDNVLYDKNGGFQEFINNFHELDRDVGLGVIAPFVEFAEKYREYVTGSPTAIRISADATMRLNKICELFYNTLNKYNNYLNAMSYFGVDQGALKKSVSSPTKESEIVNIFREVFPDMSLLEARKLMSVIDSQGICSYAGAANTMIANFIGEEGKFKECFGFDLFENNNGNLEINDHILLAKFFASVNRDNKGMIKKTNKGYKIAKNDLKQLYISGGGLHADLVNKFFDYYGIPLTCSSRIIARSNVQTDGYGNYAYGNLTKKDIYKINADLIRSLADGKQIELVVYKNKGEKNDIVLHGINCMDAKLKGRHAVAHSVFVTGIDPNGNILISTWQSNYYLSWDDLCKHGFEFSEVTYKEK